MPMNFRWHSPLGAFLHDLVMIPIAWYLAYWLRFNLGTIPEYMLDRATAVLPVLVIAQGVVFWYFGLYRGVWRFASIPDLMRIGKALAVGIVAAAITIFFTFRMEGIPRTIFPLYGLLLLMLLGGPRLLYRWIREHQLDTAAEKRVLIVGAGQAGEVLARELLRTPLYGYKPVAFVDDDLAKAGSEIHGIRVVGGCDQIPAVALDKRIEFVLLAVPTAGPRNLRRIVGLCEQSGVAFRMLPLMDDLRSNRSAFHALRDVSIEDLLGREPVSLDWESISRGVSGKIVLVSGGGGSIGSELSRQLAGLNPRELYVLDNSEFNLYSVEMDLRKQFPQLALRVRLVDVCDTVSVERLFAEIQPNIVFHAAAYKHVPMLEEQAREAVRNNVLGTRTIASVAVDNHTEAFVLISTDKAVNPTNVMGASKRVAEILCQNLDAHNNRTKFITVRFGNVLDSAGSVVPLFRKQIDDGGPVTVTHPEVKRYFMTIPEACQLILEAGAIGRGGEVYVLDMGEPIKISYLAEQMITLAGRVPGDDIEIAYTGLRPGEKLFEELFHEQESLTATGMEKLLLARYREVDWPQFNLQLNALVKACEDCDEIAVRALLDKLVPEFESGRRAGRSSNVVSLDAVTR